jgi:gliding motility-associated-like protein
MLPTITSSIEATICSGSTYDFNGTILGDEGVYLDTLATLDGCDSVIILSLFVNPPTVNYEVAEICQGENFVFGNLTLNTSGIYTDTVQTASGCDSLNILELSVVDCEFQISNILTPNDDGQNDTWKVSDVSKIAGCDVNIYNRWGELVFETNDYNNQWAGTRNNEQLPDGVYFYSIKCSNSDEYTGEINLLRFKK